MKSYKEFSEGFNFAKPIQKPGIGANGARIDVQPGDDLFDVLDKASRMLTKMPIVSFNFQSKEMTITKDKYFQIIDFINKTLAAS